MNCSTFQDLLSDYLEGSVGQRLRSSLASHLIECVGCRGLYEDIRVTMGLCKDIGQVAVPADLPDRILAATTAGEMMSCTVFDELISDYFDGYVSASDFQIFQSHFEQCPRCSRLLETIRMARELCREIRQVEVPADLTDRILASTSTLADERRAQCQIKRAGARRFSWTQVRVLGSRALRAIMAPENVAASILFLATLGFLLINFSDDHSLQGIYRQVELRLERLKNRSGEVAAEKERLASNFRQIQFQVSSAIDSGSTLFGHVDQPTKEEPTKPPTTEPAHAPASDPSRKEAKAEPASSGLE